MPEYFWGAGEQLYYFQGFGKRHEQNNFRQQRKVLSGSWGDSSIIFREQGSTDPHPRGGGGLINTYTFSKNVFELYGLLTCRFGITSVLLSRRKWFSVIWQEKLA